MAARQFVATAWAAAAGAVDSAIQRDIGRIVARESAL